MRMMFKRSKLLAPLTFLRLESPELCRYQWYIPLLMSLGTLTIFYLLPIEPNLLAPNGIVGLVNGLLGTLIGFYIAALAAIATFSNKTLDLEMKGRAPKLKYYRGGEQHIEILTRRRFLSIIFGYCAFLSIVLYGLSIVTIGVEPSVAQGLFKSILKFVFISWYLYMLSSLTVVTLLGLHYLIDRMHRD